MIIVQYLEVREKQYDKKAYLDVFTVSNICHDYSRLYMINYVSEESVVDGVQCLCSIHATNFT